MCSNQDLWPDVTFNVGTGLDAEQREALWLIRDSGLIGQTIKFKYQKIGTADKPRIPVFLGFRAKEDMS